MQTWQNGCNALAVQIELVRNLHLVMQKIKGHCPKVLNQ